MNWQSRTEIIDALGLESDAGDLPALKSELRDILIGIHPDRNGGMFKSGKDEARYHKATSALEFLEANESTALAMIPVGQLPAIIKAVTEAIAPLREPSASDLSEKCRVTNHSEVTKRYQVQRMTSGTLAAIGGALFAFSSSLKDNLLLGPLATDPVVQACVLTLAIMCAILYMLTRVREKSEESHLDWLMSDEGCAFLLSSSVEPDSREFTLRDFKQTSWGRKRHPLRLRTPTSSVSAMEGIAKFHIKNLEEQGLIKLVRRIGLDPVYRVDDSVDLRHSSRYDDI